MRVLLKAVLAFGLLAVPGVIAAETLTVEGVYGSRVALPGDIEVIAADSFGGDIGPDVALDLSEALGGVFIQGEPFFRVIPEALVDRDNPPDAVLRGTVRSIFRDRRVGDKETRECVARDADDKCTERVKVKVRCDELTVRLDPRILLVDGEGRQLYSRMDPITESIRFCEDEDIRFNPDEMVYSLAEKLVDEVVADLAPQQRRSGIRIMESRKDLAREDRDAFRAAVRLTDDDPAAACAAFRGLEANNPSQVSLLFNIGLCAESEGSLDIARDYYSLALNVDPGRDYPTFAMDRLASRERGEAQMAARQGS